MAAIDKLYTDDFTEFDEFREWVLEFRPRLLKQMYFPFLTYNEWRQSGRDLIPVANFSRFADLTLLWRCPMDFVRVYLEKQCGLKTRWYHRFFFKCL